MPTSADLRAWPPPWDGDGQQHALSSNHFCKMYSCCYFLSTTIIRIYTSMHWRKSWCQSWLWVHDEVSAAYKVPVIANVFDSDVQLCYNFRATHRGLISPWFRPVAPADDMSPSWSVSSTSSRDEPSVPGHQLPPDSLHTDNTPWWGNHVGVLPWNKELPWCQLCRHWRQRRLS